MYPKTASHMMLKYCMERLLCTTFGMRYTFSNIVRQAKEMKGSKLNAGMFSHEFNFPLTSSRM
jgi:hypothetical protein